MKAPLSLAALMYGLAAGPVAAGGGLAVAPVSIEFGPGVRARSIEVSNPGNEAIDVQVRLFAWTLDETGDRYEPSRDLSFSPPMFQVAPGGRQIVRVAAPATPPERELSYRLFVDQLPGPAQGGRLQLPVRMVLPLFVAPARAGQAGRPGRNERLAWRARRDAGGRMRLEAANLDSRRVKVINLAYVAGDARHSIQAGLAGYVLTGQKRSWTFPYKEASTEFEVTADTDEGPLRARVKVVTD